MNYIEFGQQVKAKYPQYKNIPDEELAKTVIEMYPTYDSWVTENNDGSARTINPQLGGQQQGLQQQNNQGLIDTSQYNAEPVQDPYANAGLIDTSLYERDVQQEKDYGSVGGVIRNSKQVQDDVGVLSNFSNELYKVIRQMPAGDPRRAEATRFVQEIAKRNSAQADQMVQQVSTGNIVKEFAGNTVKSTGKFLGSLGKAALNVFNPSKDNTLYQIGKFGVGLVEKAIPGKQKSEESVDALIQNYKQFYGLDQKDSGDTLRHMAANIFEDPIRALNDVTSIVALGGGALKTAGKVTGSQALESVGSQVTQGALDINPAYQTFNAIRGVKNKVQEFRAEHAIPEEGTKNMLQSGGDTQGGNAMVSKKAVGQIKQDYDEYLKQAKRAAADYSEETPLEMAGKKGEDAVADLNSRLKIIGEAKRDALSQAATVKVPEAGGASAKFLKMLEERTGTTIDDAGNVADAAGRFSKVALDPSDLGLIRKIYAQLNKLDDASTTVQVDDVVDSIQDLVYKTKQNVATPVNGAVEGVVKQVTGELNGTLKSAVDEATGSMTYTNANADYSRIVDVRDQLNKALGYEGSKGGSLMKKIFSPADGGTKDLFKTVKKITGIDLVKESTLAKFAMEVVKDPRQTNLLEQLQILGNPSASNILAKAFDFLMGKSMDKSKAANIIMKK